MRTNLVQTLKESAKRMNLNRIAKRVALIGLFISLGVGNMWGGDSYYAKVTASANPTGAGSVYVNYKTNAKGSANNAKGDDEQNKLQDFYLWAVTGYGYSWGNWSHVSGDGTYSFPAAQQAIKQGAKYQATTKNSDGTNNYSVRANFNRRSIEAAGVSGSNMATQTWKSHAGTTVYLEDKYALQNSDVPLSYSPASIGGLTPSASWVIGTTNDDSDGAAVTNGKWTVSLAYDITGNPTALVHNTSRTLTISETGAVQSKTVNVPLDLTPVFSIPDGYAFPETAVGSTDTYSFSPSDYGDLPMGNAKLSWTAELTGANANQFSISSATPTNGAVTVTFAPTVSQSSTAAVVLTATWQDANGANLSYSQTFNLNGDTPLDYEAKVISSTDVVLFEGDFVDAVPIANANANSTLQLVNDVVVTSSVEFTNTLTLDLYGKELRRTGMTAADQLILFNTASKKLTIKDSKPGALGTIYAAGNANAQLQAVKVANGTVEASNCKIFIENTNTNGTEATKYAIGVYVATGKTFSMTGGTITVNRTGGRNGYGVYAEKTSTVILEDVTMNTAAPSYAYCVWSDGTLTITNVNASATGTYTYTVHADANATTIINSGTFTATTTGGNYARAILSKGNTAILDGTFTATSTGTSAAAIYASAGIVAVKKGTFSATATGTTAYGMHLNGGSCRAVVYGGTFTGLANGASSTTAAGVRVENTSVLEATAGTFSGTVDANGYTAATNVNSYGLCLASGGTASVSGATLKAENKRTYSRYAYGVYSQGALSLSNCTIDVKSVYQYNMGISIEKNTANIRDCNVTVQSTGAAYNYGIYINNASAIANVENTKFTVTSYTTYAYGANVNNGTLNATNSTFDVTANQTTATSTADANCHAIHVNTGKTANLRGCTIIAKTPKTDYYNSSEGKYVGISRFAYGVYNAGKVEIDDCTISATSYYQYAYAVRGTTSSTYTHINSGKFKTSVTTTAQAATQAPIYRDETKGKTVVYGGFFDKNTNLDYYVEEGYGINPLGSDRAEYSEGYRYTVEATSEQGNYVCKIGSTRYRTLEEALQYANQNTNTELTILMTANYTLPAGEYVLPPKATLLVPYSESQTAAKKTSLERMDNTAGTRATYLRLTFAEGVNMTVKGIVEVGGKQYSGGGANTGSNGGNFGQLDLEEGSHIDFDNGSYLYAWGFVTGKGIINARNGTKVYEQFVMGDWKGGAQAYAMLNNRGETNPKVFFISHYFYQNIECPIYYRPGAEAYGSSAVYVSSSTYPVNNVGLVGKSGNFLFLMEDATESADTWVRKTYDPKTDRVEWALNSGASINGMTITISGIPLMGTMTFNSTNYNLPICSNMTIKMNEGTTYLGQDMVFLPGSKLIVNKEATCEISSGKSVYFYDGNEYVQVWNSSSTKTIYRIGYSPSWASNPRPQTFIDVEVFVHGKMDVYGNLYTTTQGANIHSTNEDAGKITFHTAVPASTSATIGQHTSGSGSGTSGKAYYTKHPLTYAQLRNGEAYVDTPDSVSLTAGTAAGDTWVYKNDMWEKMTEDGCFNKKTVGSQVHYYIQPSDIVEVDYPARADHAYKATNEERYFINAADCQWWEAELQNIGGTDYYVANQEKYDNYGTCYYYDASPGVDYWKPQNVTVTWNIQTLSGAKTITYTDVPLNTRPKYNSEDPAKAGDGSADFVWTGWENAAGNIYGRNETLPIATGNVTYTAIFERRPYTYTIAFLNPDGSPISGKKYEVGEIPVAPEAPEMAPTTELEYEFTGWNKQIVAVTGPDAYTAVYASHPRKYAIKFYDYDGKTLLQSSMVAYNTLPTFNSTLPNHSDKYYTYAFDGWSPEITVVKGTANYIARYNITKNKYTITFKNPNGTIIDQQLLDAGETPTPPANPTMEAVDLVYTFTGWDRAMEEVTEDAIYTASYSSTPRSYTIRFVNWNNVELQKTQVAYNTMPTAPATNPSRPSDTEYDYDFAGWTPSLAAVSGDETYRATFTGTKKKYTILFQNPKNTTLANPASADNKWEYGSTPSFTGVTPTKASDTYYSYEFNTWTPTISEVTGDKTYIADFIATERKYTVTWNANGGWCETASTNVKGGESVGTLPIATREEYIFDGWFTESSGGSQIAETQIITGDVPYYAHWTPATVKVSKEGVPTTYHTTIADAITDANGKTGATVTMLQNASTTEQTITAAMTIDLNGHTISSTLASNTGVFKINASGKTITIQDSGTGGRIDHTATYAGHLYGINLIAGSLDIQGGTIYAQNNASSTETDYRAIGINGASTAPITMSAGTVEVQSPNCKAPFGIYTTGNLTMTGGAIRSSGTGSVRGIYVKGTTELTNATITATATSTNCYAIYAKAGTVTINSGTYTATATGTCYTIYEEAGSVTIYNGRFKASTKELNKTGGSASLYGGYYVHNTDLAANCATNYHVFPASLTEGGVTYNYEVAQGYTLTWSTDGDALTGDYTSGTVKVGTTLVAPNTPTKAGYTFSAWTPAVSATMPSANTTYTATWNYVSPSGLSIASDGNKWDFCTGESMKLTVSGSNIAAEATYQWKKWNGSSWDNIAGATSVSYTTSMEGNKAGQYCCTVTNATGYAATASGVWVRVWQLHLDDSDIDFTNTGTGTGCNTAVALSSDTHYEFKLKDNNGGWFGLNSKTVTRTESAFALNGTGANVNITAGMTGNYTFTINYSDKNNPTIAITYPTANQAAGYDIYFDKSVITGWTSESTSDIFLRIGKSTNNKNNTTDSKIWTLVPGTDRFYTIKTLAYNGFEAWQIANNASWTGDGKSIYLVNTGDSYAITKATNFQKYVVDASGITIVPTTVNNTENGCTYWNVSKSSGMLTHTATITTPTDGTITISNTAQSLSETATTADIPHRTILTITATPNAGYKCTSLTVNGETFTNGSTHILAADATIAATFEIDETGPVMDIVDWTSSTLTINLNGIPAAGWNYTIKVGEMDSHTYAKDDRNDDRTLTVDYKDEIHIPNPDTQLRIVVTDKDNQVYSNHQYIIPHVYSSSETLNNENINDINENSILFVNSGALTITYTEDTVRVNAIYVAPGAELKVNTDVKLKVDSLMLRTTPWEAAILDVDDLAKIKSKKTYYTRKIADNSKYYQFAIPLSSNINNVRLSDGSKSTYNKSWILKSYEESLRAANGPINDEDYSNWKLLTTEVGEGKDNGVIAASKGYEIFSNTPYYREYYFPVTLPSSPTTLVGVSCTKPEGKTEQWYEANSGWNALCSPLLGKYVQDFGTHPEDGLKVSELLSDGHYWQHPSNVIYPAVPFYYQAPQTGVLHFDSKMTIANNAPRRAWNTSIPTQWLQLTIQNTNGDKLDETSIYAHPEKFAPEYEAGYDVAKQSLTGGKALLYSELPCGKLAFAAVPDSLAETRIPLTVYAAAEGEYIFSMIENDYLGRLQYVLLLDTQTGLVTDLLERDCAADFAQGTNAGRFYLQCVFATDAPEVSTGVNHIKSENEQVQKIIYNDKVYIIYQGRVYDMTGRQCELR